MARQLVQHLLRIRLPGLSSELRHTDDITGEVVMVEFKVTEPKEIALRNIESEKREGEVLFDLVGQVAEYNLAICFTHPERSAPISLQNFTSNRYGVIEVSLTKTRDLLIDAKKQGRSYGAALTEFLENDISSKKWLFHPRYIKNKQIAEIELEEKIRLAKLGKHIKYKYSCGKCDYSWIGSESSSKCAKCNNHLYSFRGGSV